MTGTQILSFLLSSSTFMSSVSDLVLLALALDWLAWDWFGTACEHGNIAKDYQCESALPTGGGVSFGTGCLGLEVCSPTVEMGSVILGLPAIPSSDLEVP